MVKVVGDVAVSMFAYLYCIMGLPEYCFPPHVSYKALGTLVFLFMSLLLQWLYPSTNVVTNNYILLWCSVTFLSLPLEIAAANNISA